MNRPPYGFPTHLANATNGWVMVTWVQQHIKTYLPSPLLKALIFVWPTRYEYGLGVVF